MPVEKPNTKEEKIAALKERQDAAEMALIDARLKASELSGKERIAAEAKQLRLSNEIDGFSSRIKALKEEISDADLKEFQKTKPIHFACWQAILAVSQRPERLHELIEHVKKSIPLTISSQSDPKKATLLANVVTSLNTDRVTWKQEEDKLNVNSFKNSVQPTDFARRWTVAADTAANHFAKEMAPLIKFNLISSKQANDIQREHIQKNLQRFFAVVNTHKIYPTEKDSLADLKQQLAKRYPEHTKKILAGKKVKTDNLFLKLATQEISQRENAIKVKASKSWLEIVANAMMSFRRKDTAPMPDKPTQEKPESPSPSRR